MKKVLVIGNGDSIFVKDFIDKLSNNDIEIFLLSEGNVKQIEKAKTVKLFSNDEPNKYLNLLLRIKKLFEILIGVKEKYDVIVIHFIQFFYAPLIPILKYKSHRLVGVFWGSDYYKNQTRFKKAALNQICHNLDNIVFTNELTLKDFNLKFPKIDKSKLKVARFGLPALEEIDNLLLKRQQYPQWCKQFGVPVEKIKIMVGYNASLYHKQIEVIQEIDKFNELLKNKIHLVFPLGYGSKQSNNLIRETLNSTSNITFTILEEFYDFREVAKLRMITDILINIQPSDQFSGSMQETLYAGGWILTGTWLPYQKVLENNPKIDLIESFDDFPNVLSRMIENDVHNGENQVLEIREFISQSSSWKSNIKLWKEILFNENSK